MLNPYRKVKFEIGKAWESKHFGVLACHYTDGVQADGFVA